MLVESQLCFSACLCAFIWDFYFQGMPIINTTSAGRGPASPLNGKQLCFLTSMINILPPFRQKGGKGQLFVKLGLLLASDSPTVRWSTVPSISTWAIPDHMSETLGPRETNGNMDHMHPAELWVMKLCLISLKGPSCQCLPDNDQLTCLHYRTTFSVHESAHWGSGLFRYCITKS